MRYKGRIIRPPSEADSLLLQITYGCSHNRCTFCPTYKDKKFALRSLDEIIEDIYGVDFEVNRVFLCDGDALVTPTEKLSVIVNALNDKFPALNRIGTYGNARSILLKTPDELELLRAKKLKIIYMGLESGSNRILKKINKGSTAEEMISAAERVKSANIKLSVMALNGIAGKSQSTVHAEETGKVLSLMKADYISLLTVMACPGTEFYDAIEKGEIVLPQAMEILKEIRTIIENLSVERALFLANHASNYLPLRGRLPKDKEKLLSIIDSVISGERTELLRPEFLRGL